MLTVLSRGSHSVGLAVGLAHVVRSDSGGGGGGGDEGVCGWACDKWPSFGAVSLLPMMG